MKTRPLRVYLDSNALIAYLADEKGRASVVESVLEDGPQRQDIAAHICAVDN